MFCNKCGKEISDDSRFCKYCRTAVNYSQTHKINVNTGGKIYKKWWFWLIIVIVSIFGLIALGSTSETENKDKSDNGINSNIVYSTNKEKIKNDISIKNASNEINTEIISNSEKGTKNNIIQEEQESYINDDNTSTSDKTNSKSNNNDEQKNKKDEESKSNSSTNIKDSSSIENSEMVWVGETGTKYHYKDCRTLKGKGHQITLEQAQEEGREPCKVCY